MSLGNTVLSVPLDLEVRTVEPHVHSVLVVNTVQKLALVPAPCVGLVRTLLIQVPLHVLNVPHTRLPLLQAPRSQTAFVNPRDISGITLAIHVSVCRGSA